MLPRRAPLPPPPPPSTYRQPAPDLQQVQSEQSYLTVTPQTTISPHHTEWTHHLQQCSAVQCSAVQCTQIPVHAVCVFAARLRVAHGRL